MKRLAVDVYYFDDKKELDKITLIIVDRAELNGDELRKIAKKWAFELSKKINDKTIKRMIIRDLNKKELDDIDGDVKNA